MSASTHAAAMGAPAELDRCPIMGTYGPPSVMFVRGEAEMGRLDTQGGVI